METQFSFRLYVTAGSPNSLNAETTLRAALASIGDEADLEVVDVTQAPARAVRDGVFVTPTLIRLQPPPLARLIGNLDRGEALSKLIGRLVTI